MVDGVNHRTFALGNEIWLAAEITDFLIFFCFVLCLLGVQPGLQKYLDRVI